MSNNILQDDKGNYSSLRALLLVVMIIFIFLLYLFTKTLFFELQQDEINYQGLATLFTAMIVNVGVVLVSKIVQKKYENS